MEEHHDHGKSQTPDEIHDDGSRTLSARRHTSALVGVHEFGKRADNAESSSWQGHCSSYHELDLDIAESFTIVVTCKIVGRPDDEVNEAE